MKSSPIIGLRLALLAGCAGVALAPSIAAAQSSQPFVSFDIPAQDLDSALTRFGQQSEREIIISSALTRNRRAPAVQGNLTPEDALGLLLADSGLTYRVSSAGSLVVEAADPQSGSAAGGGAEVEALIVTAQKREEDIQDVPIAISAFTQESLERSQIAGGPDLMTQVPNMTFTKTNFTGYSIQLRGIGTQAISATTDAAVAVAFNNTPFIRNRFFEQEFYDLQRVEVLRGPQGTLYGRNATAGVVNIISAKPKFAYEAKLSGDLANYNSTRLEGMVNIPLVEDKVALRLAGAWTKREGFVTNEITGNPIDGRDLWSTRLSLRFEPNERLSANLIWEHFEEDDDRLRSGKQLCKTDVVGDFTAIMPDGQIVVIPASTVPGSLPTTSNGATWTGLQGTFSQGCSPASLYAKDSFLTPNGLSLPYVHPLTTIALPITESGGTGTYLDPYASRTQSTDLRVIESTYDPTYQAEADVLELQFNLDLTDSLSLASETAYSSDIIFSTQDYNRFNTASGLFKQAVPGVTNRENVLIEGPNGGIFCDPQIGCADRLVAVDLATARSRQFSQEFRVSSNYDAPFNFSLGANFLRYDTEDKYYVFINTLSMYAAMGNYGAAGSPYVPGVADNVDCLKYGFAQPNIGEIQLLNGCIYMDPNPLGSLNDRGHNYFLSKNPYKLISYAVFGESYWNVTDALKVTAGLRWTVDKKEAPRIPSWVLAAETVGYPVYEVVEQEWREPTGRLAIDWKPDLAFTDETLLYASIARGYKAGGMNPPAAGVVCRACDGVGSTEFATALLEATHPKSFDPEFVNAFEVGSKNTLLDGKLTLNLAGFYYDYQGYQISYIVNRSAVNLNFDAQVWGLEIEADWRPLENLRLGFKAGYENTRVADGENAVDVMDRTAGDPNWIVVRPFPTFPSNCIVPAWIYIADVPGVPGAQNLTDVGIRGTGGLGPCELAYVMNLDPVTGYEYEPDPQSQNATLVANMFPWYVDYPGWDPQTAPNHGAGISKDLSGNELPNAPDFTATITADYTIPLPNDWLATLHTDLYYQSEAWTRIFNTEGYDKLKAYTNVNLAAIFTNEDAGWKVMAYVKNVMDRDSITGAFLNSDDTGLTTNVFLTEPRLYGLRVTKDFAGGPWWTGVPQGHTGPFPLTVELSGDVQRHEASYGTIPLQSFTALSAELREPAGVYNDDLDRGDGRGIKLTYRAAGSPLSFSVGARTSTANTSTDSDRMEVTTILDSCRYPLDHFFAGLVCIPGAPFYEDPNFLNLRTFEANEWSEVSTKSRENHTFYDVQVGWQFAAGFFAQSEIKAGLRHATLKSETELTAQALGNWIVPDGWFGDTVNFEDASYEFSRVNLAVARKFKGMGPTVTWDAAINLLGSNDTGRLNAEWQVTAGALFGDRETNFEGQEDRRVHAGFGAGFPLAPTGVLETFSPPPDRSKSITVPVVDLSLGLAYEISRIKIGAGYRWERYFDVLDSGYSEAKDADRTIDGPYFKIAVGFGS